MLLWCQLNSLACPSLLSLSLFLQQIIESGSRCAPVAGGSIHLHAPNKLRNWTTLQTTTTTDDDDDDDYDELLNIVTCALNLFFARALALLARFFNYLYFSSSKRKYNTNNMDEDGDEDDDDDGDGDGSRQAVGQLVGVTRQWRRRRPFETAALLRHTSGRAGKQQANSKNNARQQNV